MDSNNAGLSDAGEVGHVPAEPAEQMPTSPAAEAVDESAPVENAPETAEAVTQDAAAVASADVPVNDTEATAQGYDVGESAPAESSPAVEDASTAAMHVDDAGATAQGDDAGESAPVESSSAVEEAPVIAMSEDATAFASVEEAALPTSEGAPAAEEAPAAPAVAPSGLKRGDVVETTIVSTSPVQIVVEIKEGVQGIITTHEIEKMSRQNLEALKVGETVTVYVINPHDKDGKVIVSINRALEELDWKQAEDYRQSQEPFETRIAGYNKGGLIARFGRLRGFIPQSQLSGDRRRPGENETPEEHYSKMINEAITIKVMEVDRARNRLILSERMASRESREKRKEALVNQLTVGEVRTGRVVSLEDFGAFVDIGGAEGLVHLTEISWQHVTHPREALKPGQEVKVEVISIDKEHKRIGLSMKRQSPDPWDTIAVTYEVGQLVQGVVTKLTKFGAFVQLVDMPEIEGLIHISELSERRVNTPREVVNEGDKLTLRVVKIDIKDRRLGLSLKRVNSAEYLDRDWGG
jgi:small subunit ribosomal protein S1